MSKVQRFEVDEIEDQYYLSDPKQAMNPEKDEDRHEAVVQNEM